jgi:voltage-gated potassium channel
LLERTTALLLTASIFIRGLYTKDYKEPIFGNLYLFIDLISIVPFWIGFFIPTEYLPIIKAFRVFRLLDLVVHLKPFRLVYFSFHRIRKQLCTLASVWLFVAFISSLMVYETERHTQPEFRDFYNCMYFTYVTSATIGYGDMTAKTTVGRIVTSISSGICLMIFAGIIGVIGTSITHVMGNYHDDDDVKVNFLVDKRIF